MFVSENKGTIVDNCEEIMDFFYHKTQEVGRNTRLSARVPPYTSFVLAPLPVCFITEQSTVEAYLFVNFVSFLYIRYKYSNRRHELNSYTDPGRPVIPRAT